MFVGFLTIFVFSHIYFCY
jgi:cysteinyl-tRNA synthetase